MNKRSFLSIMGGLTFPTILNAQYGKAVKAKNIIYIYLDGGISSQETWNPKPFADAEFRGPYEAIKTKTDGLLFSDRFPLLAKETDKFSVINSMTHGQAAHERGTEYMFTGYKPSPAIKYPSVGSIVSHELGFRNSLPAYVSVPVEQNEFASTGFLSAKFGSFSLGADPAAKDFKVRDLKNGVSNRKRDLLELVDSKFKREIKSDNVIAMDKFYDQAFDLMSSEAAMQAFDISKESETMKDMYGKTQPGQRLLISRRLVEAGVRIVKVNYGGWDNHDKIKNSFDAKAPDLDKALSALFTDLAARGILDETMVIVTSEFGRTPKINKTAGRDHWPRNFSTIIGGGGINNGMVYGTTDSISNEVEESPVSPEDLFATMFHLAGIDSTKELMTPDLRPIKISKGNIISELI